MRVQEEFLRDGPAGSTVDLTPWSVNRQQPAASAETVAFSASQALAKAIRSASRTRLAALAKFASRVAPSRRPARRPDMPGHTQTQQLYAQPAEPKPLQLRKAKPGGGANSPQQHGHEASTSSATAAAAGTGPAACNIMFDRRVVRGNTYGMRVLPAEPVLTLTSKPQPAATAAATRRMPGKRRTISTPEPVQGRKHMDVQTDVYLEELSDAVPEADSTTQTDAFAERPPSPVFVPPKSGVDGATQIEQGELFDFDAEVEPLLEVLVGKVLEQSLMEVLEEEELAAMRAHQQHFQAIRAAELVAAQRLEAAERRKVEEKERRLKQERERRERERVVRAKVAASALARGYLSGIVANVFRRLEDDGFFYDPVEKEVQDVMLPWLTQQAVAHLERGLLARAVVQQLVADAVALRASQAKGAAALADAQAAVAEACAAAEAQAVAAARAAEQQEISSKATFILTQLRLPLVRQEQVDAVREELGGKAASDADAALEAERACVGDATRAELEAQLAAAAAAAEAAAAEAESNGEEPSPYQEPDLDVEGRVAAAMAAVAAQPAAPVTDADVLSALMEQGVLTKDAIVNALAVSMLGGGGGGEGGI